MFWRSIACLKGISIGLKIKMRKISSFKPIWPPKLKMAEKVKKILQKNSRIMEQISMFNRLFKKNFDWPGNKATNFFFTNMATEVQNGRQSRKNFQKLCCDQWGAQSCKPRLTDGRFPRDHCVRFFLKPRTIWFRLGTLSEFWCLPPCVSPGTFLKLTLHFILGYSVDVLGRNQFCARSLRRSTPLMESVRGSVAKPGLSRCRFPTGRFLSPHLLEATHDLVPIGNSGRVLIVTSV